MKKKVILIGIIIALAAGAGILKYKNDVVNKSADTSSTAAAQKDKNNKAEETQTSGTESQNSSNDNKNSDTSKENSTQSSNTASSNTSASTNTSQADAKADEYNQYAEEVVTNFSNLYPAVINNSDMNISMLNNVLLANSDAYSQVKKEIEDYKKDNANVTFDNFSIDSIKKTASGDYEVTVDQSISITVGGSTKKQEGKAIYKVKISSKQTGIYEITK